FFAAVAALLAFFAVPEVAGFFDFAGDAFMSLRVPPVEVAADVSRRSGGRGLGPVPELAVTRPQEPARVALLGDVAAEELARADVDRVVGEEPVEDVRLVARVEVVEADHFHLLEVGT